MALHTAHTGSSLPGSISASRSTSTCRAAARRGHDITACSEPGSRRHLQQRLCPNLAQLCGTHRLARLTQMRQHAGRHASHDALLDLHMVPGLSMLAARSQVPSSTLQSRDGRMRVTARRPTCQPRCLSQPAHGARVVHFGCKDPSAQFKITQQGTLPEHADEAIGRLACRCTEACGSPAGRQGPRGT